MPADLTREEIERLPDVLAEMESRLHFGGDPEDDRPATEVWSELWFCDADYMLVFKAARLALSEPTRLAAARAEGYREGVEAAARWHDEQARLFTSAGGRWDGAHTSALLTAAADHRQHAAAIRALTPPPAEPAWIPTHRHYKGTLYRVTKRGKRMWAGNDERNGSMLVEYDNAAGGEFALSEGDFDSEVEDGIRRYAPLDAESAQPDDGWIELKGGRCPVNEGDEAPRLDLRFRDGTEVRSVRPSGWRWSCTGEAGDILAYRIVKPAEPSAPVAGERVCPVCGREESPGERCRLCPSDLRQEFSATGAPVAPPNFTSRLVGAADRVVSKTYRIPPAALTGEVRFNLKELRDLINEWNASPHLWSTHRPGAKVSTLEAENAALRERNGKLVDAIKLGLEYWAHRQQRYKNRHPAWVVEARALLQGQGGGDA